MIGNDIIDISLATQTSKSSNFRFLKKIFTTEEIDEILNSDEPELRLWSFWSMKEAAYKAHQRNLKFKRKLDPFNYKCNLASGKVRVDDKTFSIHTELTLDFIHSYTTSENNHISFLANTANLKSAIEKAISEANNLKNSEIEYFKDANCLPVYGLQNSSSFLPISLSHHGKFAAICFPLINC